MEQYIMSRFHDPEATPSDDRPELLRVTQQLMKQNVKPKQLIAQITQASLDANLRAEAARVIDAEHIPMSLSDALLRRALKVAQAIDESSWDADLLGLAGILSHPMSFVVELVLRKYDAAETLKVDQHAMKRMLRELERGYLANPYHCSIHGADVAYTLHVMLEKGVEGKLGLTKLQLVSSIIAAAAHDFRHNGLTNQYLVATNHPLALMYNDKAVLESMHASEFFSLLHSDKELNIFAKLEPASKSAVRKTVIASILATDMAVHFDFLSRFQSSIVAVERDLSASPYTADEQNFIISMLCHAADISNPAKNRSIYLDWTDRVLAEFYHVGDLEKEQGFPSISMFCDRSQPKVQKCQNGFITFIVKPMFAAWCEYVPSLHGMIMPLLEGNLSIWGADACKVPETQLFVDAAKAGWDYETARWSLKEGMSSPDFAEGLLS
uniref:Phosphodiesterase n=1 Tax=Haptolina ericina TaxID=156174 RepID=A0A7S3ADM9_9EUKA